MSRLSPCGVHLVGSAPFANADETMRTLAAGLGNHIKSIPDGETGIRSNWVACQFSTFTHVPQVINPFWSKIEWPTQFDPENLLAPEQIAPLLGKLDTQYDKWAIESYQTFTQLRDQVVIPKHVKFQVCLPTPLNAMFVIIAPPYRATIEPLYEAALVQAVRNIQNSIPHKDLLIQFDVACEFALLEGTHRQKDNAYGWKTEMIPWFDDEREGTIDRIVRVMGNGHVDDDVALGVHLCYGDFMGAHFTQPDNIGILAGVAEALMTRVGRKLEHIHMPVPKPRDDDDYLNPARSIMPLLKDQGTYLFLGLVHPGDAEGTERRINAAKKVLGNDGWGVATECGLGRFSKEQVKSFCDISSSLVRPWTFDGPQSRLNWMSRLRKAFDTLLSYIYRRLTFWTKLPLLTRPKTE